MLLKNVLVSSALVLAAAAAPAKPVVFHVTDLLISGNPDDDKPEISFSVSGDNPNKPERSFDTTECSVNMEWGSNKENNTLAGAKWHKCDNKDVEFNFCINWFYNGYNLYRYGYILWVTHHFGPKNEVNHFNIEFHPDVVKRTGEGEAGYTYIDTEPDFYRKAHYGKGH